MHISDIQFRDIKGTSALCVLVTKTGVISHQCNSGLNGDAPQSEHRTTWLKDALRKQRRMPEFRGNTNNIEICPTALRYTGVTEL